MILPYQVMTYICLLVNIPISITPHCSFVAVYVCRYYLFIADYKIIYQCFPKKGYFFQVELPVNLLKKGVLFCRKISEKGGHFRFENEHDYPLFQGVRGPGVCDNIPFLSQVCCVWHQL